jgi:hypothetical protein
VKWLEPVSKLISLLIIKFPFSSKKPSLITKFETWEFLFTIKFRWIIAVAELLPILKEPFSPSVTLPHAYSKPVLKFNVPFNVRSLWQISTPLPRFTVVTFTALLKRTVFPFVFTVVIVASLPIVISEVAFKVCIGLTKRITCDGFIVSTIPREALVFILSKEMFCSPFPANTVLCPELLVLDVPNP